MAAKLTIPDRLAFRQGIKLVEEIHEIAPMYKDLVLASDELNWVEPFPMVLLACCVDQLRIEGKTIHVTSTKKSSYAAHIGLFHALDPTLPEPTSENRSNDRYIAISRIPVKYFLEQANMHMTPDVADYIEAHALKLALVLTQVQDKYDELVQLLKYCFTEIIRNVYEHSDSDELIVCAQYWPKVDRVDLAIADRGMGLRQALSNNPFIEMANDRDAILFALMPGVSGRAYVGAPPQVGVGGHWQNSGYGLYMTHRLCMEGGSFTICTGRAGLRFNDGSREEIPSVNHRGTILGLSLKPKSLGKIRQKIEQFAREGGEIAKTYRGAIINASTASLALR